MSTSKQVASIIKLQIAAGQANPAPPVGPALGAHGLNIMDFCKAFNAQTQGQIGHTVPVVITAYSDRSFDFAIEKPSAAVPLPQETAMHASAGEARVNALTAKEVALSKMADLNVVSIEGAMKFVEGSARSMGIEVEGTEYTAPRGRGNRIDCT